MVMAREEAILSFYRKRDENNGLVIPWTQSQCPHSKTCRLWSLLQLNLWGFRAIPLSNSQVHKGSLANILSPVCILHLCRLCLCQVHCDFALNTLLQKERRKAKFMHKSFFIFLLSFFFLHFCLMMKFEKTDKLFKITSSFHSAR